MTRLHFYTSEVLAFLFFTGLGLWIGSHLEQNSDPISMIQAGPDTLQPIPSLPDGERIILVVGVDRLNTPEPQLESLWLLTYYLEQKPVQWLPILPSGNVPLTSFEADLLTSFNLLRSDHEIFLDPAFLELLEAYNYWFSGYLIVDDLASAAIINLVGGLQTHHGMLSGEQAMRLVPHYSDQPATAHSQQALLLGQGCQTLKLQPAQPNWQLLLNLIPEHILTDLDPEQLISEVRTLTSPATPWHCEFPTIPALP